MRGLRMASIIIGEPFEDGGALDLAWRRRGAWYERQLAPQESGVNSKRDVFKPHAIQACIAPDTISIAPCSPLSRTLRAGSRR